MLKVTRHIASQGYDRIRCWANPVALPYGNEVLVLAQKLTLKAIDCFSDVSLFRSNDSGNSWSNASLFPHLADTVLPDGKRIAYLVSAMRLMDDNTILVLATRHCYNADNTLDEETPRCVVYFYFDPEKASCTELRKLELPAPQDAHTLAVNTQFNFQNRKQALQSLVIKITTNRKAVFYTICLGNARDFYIFSESFSVFSPVFSSDSPPSAVSPRSAVTLT